MGARQIALFAAADTAPTSEPPPPSRDVLRSRRKWPFRARTINIRRLPRAELERERVRLAVLEETDPIDARRPATRAECGDREDGRPCPWVSCKYNLYLDVSTTGAIKLNFPNLEPHEMKESCVLDVAERGGVTLEEAGAIMNLTRERIRQVEGKACRRVLENDRMEVLRELHGIGPSDAAVRRRRQVTISEYAERFDVERFAGEDLDE